ncbi:MAG: leucine-rich repeat domain-containing protein, partial [Oscillospiraceae bacterium]|nr:leucine-rich repeat domain-containing protein [Oscillospiraceae bacterium]
MEKKHLKKVLAGMTAIFMASAVVTGIPFSYSEGFAITVSAEAIASGTADNLTWILDSEGKLTISGTGEMTSRPWDSYYQDIKTVVIEEGVTSVKNEAFYDYTSLTSVTIPSSVTSVGDHAFHSCLNLKSVSFGENSQLASIGTAAFYDCTSLESIEIPDSVTSIGYGAFTSCTSLTSAVLSENSLLASIGIRVFADCSSLKGIYIPKGVTSVSEQAFMGCFELASVTFGENSLLESIGSFAFIQCKTLTSITIPEGVVSIGDYAFSNCYSLTDITLPASLTSVGDDAFSCCESLTNVYVPCTWKDEPLDYGFDIDVTPADCKGGTATCTEKAVCTVCGKEYGETDSNNHVGTATEWSCDITSHWHECACGEDLDKAGHTSSGAATEEKAETCTVCGYEIAPKLVHTHKAESDKWYSDKTSHWHECACGEDIDKAGHTSSGAATEEKAETCTVCGYEIAPKLEHTHKAESDQWYSDKT